MALGPRAPRPPSSGPRRRAGQTHGGAAEPRRGFQTGARAPTGRPARAAPYAPLRRGAGGGRAWLDMARSSSTSSWNGTLSRSYRAPCTPEGAGRRQGAAWRVMASPCTPEGAAVARGRRQGVGGLERRRLRAGPSAGAGPVPLVPASAPDTCTVSVMVRPDTCTVRLLTLQLQSPPPQPRRPLPAGRAVPVPECGAVSLRFSADFRVLL